MQAAALLDDAERDRIVGVISAWSNDLVASQVAVGHEFIPGHPGDGLDRWLLRFEGVDRDFITIWLTLDQRTLQFETQFMPCLEGHEAEVLAYLMKRNAHLLNMAFAIGPEEAIYLMGKIAAAQVTSDALDTVAGCTVAYVEDHFATAMSLAFPGRYHRRKA